MKRTTNSFLLLFLFAFSLSISAQSYREFVALHELYQKTNGEQWHTTWDLNTPVAQWDGVTVKDGHVVSLDLSNNNLEGELPMTLVNLRHLKHLDLSGNQLTGNLPQGIRRWETLKSLNIANNDFKGAIPKGFSKMENLKYLQLANNDFEDYKGLEELPKQQLVAFDMAKEFRHLDLVDINALGKLADTKYEDIKQ